MNFKGFFFTVQQIFRAFISTGHTFKSRCTATLRNWDTAIGGSSKQIISFKCAYFSSSAPTDPQMNPFKLPFAHRTHFFTNCNTLFCKELPNKAKQKCLQAPHDDHSETTTATIYLEGLSSNNYERLKTNNTINCSEGRLNRVKAL